MLATGQRVIIWNHMLQKTASIKTTINATGIYYEIFYKTGGATNLMVAKSWSSAIFNTGNTIG